jgi:PAS domain S-box-containing protein
MERGADIEGAEGTDAVHEIWESPALETILECVHEAFISIDESGLIRGWNREAERTFGWAKDAVVGRPLHEVLIPERYREEHKRGMRRFLLTGHGPLLARRIEIQGLHRSGREIPVEMTISALADGGRWSFHAFLRDISERRSAGELQSRLATLVEYSADAVVSRTAEGLVTTWNPGAERLYGYTAQEMLGRLADRLVPPERIAENRELVARVLGGETISGFETEHVTKDGRRVDVALTISPIFDDAGRVSELALFGRDVTTSKEAQRALVQAYEELRHAHELRSNLVAVASHEIRTPLTSVVGFATTLVARWDQLEDSNKLEFLQLIEQQGQRLRRLVDEVLLLSRLDSGRTESRPETLDVAALARRVAMELRVDGDTDVAPPNGVEVSATPAHVHQILVNFLGNAAAYGKPPFLVEVDGDEEQVVVRVSDCGPGVPDDFVPRLFDAYTRAGEGGEAWKQGSGLGLAIAKGLAEGAGGEVWYEPGRERGACFCLRLPAAPPS